MATFSAASFRNAAPGLGVLAQAIGGGSGGAYEKARQGEISLQSKLAQALAEQQAHEASARLNTAKAAGTEERNAMAQPDALRRSAMTSYGIPLDEESAVTNYFQTGALGGKYQPPVDGVGPTAPAPDWQKNLGDVARAIGGVQTALTIGDKNSENIAKAGAINRNSRLSDAIIAGTANRNTVGGAQAAAAGKDLYHSGADGGVLDQFQGTLDANNPLARATIGLKGAQASHQNAAAGAQSALAEQRNAITAAGKGGPGGKIPVGYRWTTGADGEAKLEPIPGGPKDPNAQTGKPLPASASKGYLENQTNLLRAQKALALVEGKTFDGVEGDPKATGMKGMLPMQLLNRADPKGVETRAAIADLGSLVIHDRSGAAVTASEFPRLAPFIPTVYDDAATSAKKLRLFEQNYRAIVEDAEEFYKASGYNVPKMRPRPIAAASASPGGANPAAPAANGFTYLGPEK